MALFAQIVEFLSSLIAPITQRKSHKERLRADLYDKRFPFFKNAMDYSNQIVAHAFITDAEVFEFGSKIRDSEFLFGSDVKDHLKLLYKEGLRLATIHQELTADLDPDRRHSLVEQKYAIVKWFYDQMSITPKLFSRYMKVDQK
jgi:hypothetical protein